MKILLIFLISCPVLVFLMPTDEPILNEIEDDLEDEDMSTDNITEKITKPPPPKVRVPPAHSSIKDEKKSEKWKVFEKNQDYYPAQLEIWPKSGFKDIHEVSEMAAYCYATEIDLYLSFASPFHGYIYPFHHFRRCHLFTGDGQSDVNLLITEDSCGLDVTYTSKNGTLQFVEFTFMIQWDKQYITQWDRKLRVTCNRAQSHRESLILTNSSEHSLSTVISMRVEDEETEDENDGVVDEDVSMRNYDPVQVGEDVTVAFNIRLPAIDALDANVVRCVAHDGLKGKDQKSVMHTYNSKDKKETTWDGVTTLLSSGCSTDETRFSNFDKNVVHGILELSNAFQVFRFPSSHFLFLECHVQVCIGKCPSPSDCNAKLKTEVSDSNDIKTVKLFRPLMVKLGPLIGVSPMDESFADPHNEKELAPASGVPTASFIAGLVGMGFVCAIVCVFMYRRLKKGTEKEYKMEYAPNAQVVNNIEEVAPLKVTPAEPTE